MRLQDAIAKYNTEVGFERIAKVKGYSKPYATLNKQGVVEKLWSKREIENLLK